MNLQRDGGRSAAAGGYGQLAATTFAGTDPGETKVMRRSGIEVVGEVPWGTHFCQFYETAQDLIETLVPYFREGLAANEFCMWVTSEPVGVEQAAASLRAQVPDLDDYTRKGQIEILDYSRWYTRSGRFSAAEVLQGWVDKLTDARQRGYEGLRLTGNTFWLEQDSWADFAEYEKTVNEVIGQYPMLALCTYSLGRCGAPEIMDVLANHQFALVKRAGRWEIIESARHKQTENALREAQERFRQIAETVPSVFWMTELRPERVLYVSPAFEQIWGVPADRLYADPRLWTEAIHPDDRARVTEAFSTWLGDPERSSYAVDYRIVRADGDICWIHDRGTPVRDPAGRVRRVAGVAEDITQHKQAEEKLGKEHRETALANRILRLFMEESGDELFDKALAVVLEATGSRHGVFGYISEPGHLVCPSLSAMLAECEVEGKCIHYPPEKWKGLWARALREKRSLFTNEAPRVPPGHVPIRNNLATPVLFQDRVIGLLNQANKDGDYTADDRELAEGIAARIAPVLYAWIEKAAREAERKQAEEALRRSREDLDRAQAVGQIGWWRLDVRSNVLTWSDENHRIFGIPPGTPMSYETFLKSVHPDDRGYVDTKWKAGLAGEDYDIEHQIVVAGGEVRWVRERAYLEFDGKGELLGGFGITQDITDRKRAEEMLRQSRDELERRVQERTAELARTVSVLQDEVRQRLEVEQALKVERQRLFSVLNRLPGYVVLKDRDYQIRFASHGYLEVFGEPGGRSCYEVEYGLDDPCDGCPMPEVLDGNRPNDWERIYPNGQTYHVWSFPFKDTDGTPLMMQLGLDVTERKRLELVAVEASEVERRRIGRDLHDTLGQSLTGLGYLVGGLSRKLTGISPEDSAAAEQIVETVKDAVTQIRALSRGLDPIGLEDEGLANALSELAYTVEATTGIRCRLQCDQGIVLEPSSTMHLYRIVQEALTNAARHARAKQVVVSLTADTDRIMLRVQDDGVGITDRARDGQGMGLRIMEYRAGIIGANLAVRAGDHGGTIVTCTLRSHAAGSGSRGESP